MKYNLKKLIQKYNNQLSKKYGVNTNILEQDFISAIDSLEGIQCDLWTDNCITWKEIDYIKKYLYYKYIENDINDFKNMEV